MQRHNVFIPRVPKTGRNSSARLRRRAHHSAAWAGPGRGLVRPHAPDRAGPDRERPAATACAFSLPASPSGKERSERCPGSTAAPYGAQRAPTRKSNGRRAAHAAVPRPYLAVRGAGGERAPPARHMRGGSRGRGWAGDPEISKEEADLIISVLINNFIM